ncbi:MAG: glycosyltransferase [Geminicoccaceae bacterium]
MSRVQPLLEHLTSLAEDRAALTGLPPGYGRLGRLALRSPRLVPAARLLSRREQRLVRAYHLIAASGLFDTEWYLDQPGMPARARRDPLRHFLEEGTARGFLPSPAWRGLDAEGCAAFAEGHGKAGRELWRYMRYGRTAAADAFRTAHSSILGPFPSGRLLAALDASPEAAGRLRLDLLTIDHALGGGANRYRNQRLSGLPPDAALGLLTYRVQERRYALDLRLAGRHVSIVAADQAELAGLLRRLSPASTLLNNLVSYPEPLALLDLLRELAAQGPLEVPLHDYYPLCPSFTLLDEQGRFCGLPGPRRCAACLAAIDLPLPGQGSIRDIGRWRAAWAALLGAADRIVCFSGASMELLLRAHQNLDPARIELRPHQVDHVPTRTLRLDPRAELHIGVVGEISPAKGAAVVAELARHLRASGSPVRLSVIGTVAEEYRAGLFQTGRYRAADLPELIERTGVNVCLVPSIWPETFCYVAEELLRLGMPVAVFDLGAPAERVRGAPRGLVLGSQEPARILAELQAWWATLARSSRVPEQAA